MSLKEEYFTSSNLDRKAGSFLAQLRRRNRIFIPEQSALLLIDLQDYFLKETSPAFVPSLKAILPRILKLRDCFLEKSRPVILTRHLDDPQSGMMAEWWGNSMLARDPLTELARQIVVKGLPIIKKSQYDAFYRTSLERQLRKLGVKQLVVSGVMTNVCCDTTARSAFVRGFEVFFPVDANAAYNEQFHLSSLINLAYGFVEPVLFKELVAAFGGAQ